MKLNSKKTQYPITALLLLVLVACVPKIIHVTNLAKLRMGMNPEEPPRLMGIAPRKVFQWSLTETGDSIIIQSYLLSSGDCGSTYFLAYKNGSLIFWGYPHEFARSSAPFIRQIGKKALSRQSRHVSGINDRESVE